MSDSIYTPITTDGSARRGEVTTAYGTFQTPAFMPVGTSGAVKALTSEDLESCGAEIILGNTYHLYLRPGTEIVKSQGGLAKFSGWNKPTLTDSGGYQVFSLKDTSSVTDEGVEFRSHHDGSRHMFTPEKVMEIQHAIGADIIMTFDQCVPYPADHQLAATGVRRTHEWASICRNVHNQLLMDEEGQHQYLFGIIQGSTFEDLRTESAEQIVSLDFPGYAVGGLSVGESKYEMERILAHTVQYLPENKPRYLMGVGYPEDILMAVSHGIDMFDCVLPTRNARTGNVFTSEGQLTYRNAEYANDDRPLDPNCDCQVCRRYSRAYLRHLYNQSEITGMVLATYHSTYFYQNLMRQIRKAIEQNRFESFRKEFLHKYRFGLESG
ncbi:MAG: tRNA guanosine(34) transglycosylase Tgt [candidate division Zixibacteria bacterium]|nr:tRNA guanosine(34) transglycosylase Tgt [candidate division Zixibacteria bacterium]